MGSREQEKKALDELFRPFVLRRAGGKCERCGAVGGTERFGRERIVLQVAHFKSRRVEHTRWDPDNVACLCKGCHFLWGHHEPDEFSAWWLARIGAAALARLNLIWRTLRQRPRPDLALMRIYIISLNKSGTGGF